MRPSSKHPPPLRGTACLNEGNPAFSWFNVENMLRREDGREACREGDRLSERTSKVYREIKIRKACFAIYYIFFTIKLRQSVMTKITQENLQTIQRCFKKRENCWCALRWHGEAFDHWFGLFRKLFARESVSDVVWNWKCESSSMIKDWAGSEGKKESSREALKSSLHALKLSPKLSSKQSETQWEILL